MNKTEVMEKLKKILIENLDSDEPIEDISPEDNLLLLGINSVTFLKVVVHCEKEFGFEFDDEELDYSLFETVSKLADYIVNNIK